MLRLRRPTSVFNLLRAQVPLRRPLPSLLTLSASTTSLPHRALASMAISQKDLFNYTSGRWVYNEALRQKERSLDFDVNGLRRIAAESVNQSPAAIVSLSKLAGGAFNRTFIITFRDGLQVVARIPYPMTVPKYFAIASEVATIEFLRCSGLPVPKIYNYSADSDNVAGTPYIMMEFVQGSKLSEVWRDLSDHDVVSVIHQITQMESQMMSLSFPAGGSLYFTSDLEKVSPGLGIPLDDKQFCVGPDTRLPLWYGKRERLDVNRGPYQSAEAALVAPAQKELAYLKQFGQPMLPLRRERRPVYNYQQQLPSYHAQNLNWYLDITSALVPRDSTLSRFCIRHPDLQFNNIIVSRSPDSGCKIVGLIDWQHTSILPMFLLAGIPDRFQNYDDEASQSLTPPSLPRDLDELTEGPRAREEYAYRCRLVHYHYVMDMKKCDQLHYSAFMDPLYALRGRLFQYAGAPWEGDSLDLKSVLIEATQNWDELTDGGVPCPIKFDAEEERETAALDDKASRMDEGFELIQRLCNIGEDGWVLTDNYESAIAFLKRLKEEGLAGAISEKERQEIMNNWPWDNMDEELQ